MKFAVRRTPRRAVPSRSPLVVIACLAIGGLGVSMTSAKRPTGDANDVKAFAAAEADSLDGSLSELERVLCDDADRATTIDAFRAARSHYKHLEGVVEFYAPALAAAFNSRRQEVDDDDAPPPSTLGPSGFPALESLLWPTLGKTQRDSARQIVASMHSLVGRVRPLTAAIRPTNTQLVELTRLELIRVSTLGIAGFDAPRSGDAMLESAAAIDGVQRLYAMARGRWPQLAGDEQALESALGNAREYLRSHGDFESFDRLRYLASFNQPAAGALHRLRHDANVAPMDMPRPLRADAVSPYDSGAFDARAYAPRMSPVPSAAIVALGKKLFFDPSLSRTGTRSCASCHRPDHAFSDGLTTPASIDSRGARITRNTPTLFNAALQPAQFYDERAVTLEDQVLEVLRSKAEMASSVEKAAASLDRKPYRSEFSHAFGDSSSVTPLRVRQALAAYIRTLISLDSRFDRAVRGDTDAITAEERHGFNLFMGKAGCGTCHFAPLFGGSAPPLYTRSDVEVIGTPTHGARLNVIDADSGRARVDHRPEHLRAFKVPSLRNVTATAPYMHNGALASLEDVMRFYEAGGGQGAGADLVNQTLAPDSLHLTASERKAIIAFLGSLSSSR